MNEIKDYTPIVPIPKVSFEESTFSDSGKRWNASTFYKYIKELKLKPFRFPLACYDLTITQNWMDNLNSERFCIECKRVMTCDINIPIVLNNQGIIIDGYHRVFKSLILGKKYIMAYRLPKMPDEDWEEMSTNK